MWPIPHNWTNFLRTLAVDNAMAVSVQNTDENQAAYGFGGALKHVYVEVDVDGTWGCASLATNLFYFSDDRTRKSKFWDVSCGLREAESLCATPSRKGAIAY